MANGTKTVNVPVPTITPEMQNQQLNMQQLAQAIGGDVGAFTPARPFELRRDFTTLSPSVQLGARQEARAGVTANIKSIMDQQRFRQSQAMFPGKLAVQQQAGLAAQRSMRPEVLAQMDRARDIEMQNLENLARQTAAQTTPGALELAQGLDQATLEERQFQNQLNIATRADKISKFGSEARIAAFDAREDVQQLDFEILQARRNKLTAEASGDPRQRDIATRSESLAYLKYAVTSARAAYGDTISPEEAAKRGITFEYDKETNRLLRITGLSDTEKQDVRDRAIESIEFYQDAGAINSQEADANIKQIQSFNEFSTEEAIATAPAVTRPPGVTVKVKLTKAKNASDPQIQTEITRLQELIAGGTLTAARLKLEQEYLSGLENILFARKGGG